MELKFLFKKFGAVVGGINISNNGVHIAAAGAKQTQKKTYKNSLALEGCVG